MTQHEVVPFVDGISAKLATRSRHVCVFLGAGAGRACGLPDVQGLQELIVESLTGGPKELTKAQFEHRNLEQFLSRLRRIAALLDDSTDDDETVDGLDAAGARALDKRLCEIIVGALDVGTADLGAMWNLAAWVAGSDYHLPVELFTVNYDLLIETALEDLRVPYFDGFVGSLQARFRPELVEARPGEAEWLPPFLVRLWKLHGSVHWTWSEGAAAEVVRLGTSPDVAPAAIYPSDTKYDESRRMPFVVLQDRFRRALNHPETLTIVAGYSFGDDHLNELLFDAAHRRPRSETLAFCFGSLPEDVAERAERTPNLQLAGREEAVIGGVRGSWKPVDEPLPDVWDEHFLLGDFSHLTGFLARSSARRGEVEKRLADLVARAVEAGDA